MASLFFLKKRRIILNLKDSRELFLKNHFEFEFEGFQRRFLKNCFEFEGFQRGFLKIRFEFEFEGFQRGLLKNRFEFEFERFQRGFLKNRFEFEGFQRGFSGRSLHLITSQLRTK